MKDAVEALISRRALEVERFKRIYNVDIDNDYNFDYVIDTTYKTPDEICDLILKRFEKFKRSLEIALKQEETDC